MMVAMAEEKEEKEEKEENEETRMKLIDSDEAFEEVENYGDTFP